MRIKHTFLFNWGSNQGIEYYSLASYNGKVWLNKVRKKKKSSIIIHSKICINIININSIKKNNISILLKPLRYFLFEILCFSKGFYFINV